STARLVAAPIAHTTGTRATIAFCTISNPARLLTSRIRSSTGTRPCRSLHPSTLSTALWRPTSSRATSRWPAKSKSAAPWSPPVALEWAGEVEERGAMEPAGRGEPGLHRGETCREAGEQGGIGQRDRRERRGVDVDPIDARLAADAARGGGVQLASRAVQGLAV